MRNTVALCMHFLGLQSCRGCTACLVWEGPTCGACLCFRFAGSWTECASPAAKVPKTGHPCRWRWSSAPSWGTSTSCTKTSLFERWIAWGGRWASVHFELGRTASTEGLKLIVNAQQSPGLAEQRLSSSLTAGKSPLECRVFAAVCFISN